MEKRWKCLAVVLVLLTLATGAQCVSGAQENTPAFFTQTVEMARLASLKRRGCGRYFLTLLLAPLLGSGDPAATQILAPSRFHDLSLPIKPGMLRFPGDPDVKLVQAEEKFGDFMLLMSKLNDYSLHLGTHLDTPGHFVHGGKTVFDYPLEQFTGRMLVIDLRHVRRAITRTDLENKSIPPKSKLFIKTSNSPLLRQKEFRTDHVYLEPAAAELLVMKEIELLAFDYFNLDNSERGKLEAHLALARAGIPVIVAADMSALGEGQYGFAAFPLPIPGVEASPLRICAWKL